MSVCICVYSSAWIADPYLQAFKSTKMQKKWRKTSNAAPARLSSTRYRWTRTTGCVARCRNAPAAEPNQLEACWVHLGWPKASCQPFTRKEMKCSCSREYLSQRGHGQEIKAHRPRPPFRRKRKIFLPLKGCCNMRYCSSGSDPAERPAHSLRGGASSWLTLTQLVAGYAH